MKNFKKVLRLIGLSALIVLAMCGVGFFGALFPNNRERVDKPITTERKDEGNDDSIENTQRD